MQIGVTVYYGQMIYLTNEIVQHRGTRGEEEDRIPRFALLEQRLRS